MATQIDSIDSVTTADPYLQKSSEFRPLYSISHTNSRAHNQTFWYATRRDSARRNDFGTEVYLSLVDLGFDPNVPAVETATVHTTCTNRDLPGKLQFGAREGDFEIEGSGPISKIRCLRKPTATIRPPLRGAAQWRLISHLALNDLSLVNEA